MKYLCLGYHDEQWLNSLSDTERDKMISDSMAFLEKLKAGKNYVDDIGLQPSTAAASLRFADGKMRITDGPFAETKEQLGGVLVLEASDLNHAIQLVSQMPCMRTGGCIEIRPINENI